MLFRASPLLQVRSVPLTAVQRGCAVAKHFARKYARVEGLPKSHYPSDERSRLVSAPVVTVVLSFCEGLELFRKHLC